MTTLDFTDREPPMNTVRGSETEVLNGNRAFYERLQGQRKKSGMEKYGWVALPVAAVAIIGVVAATSTPHQSANDVAGAPGQQSASNMSAPAPVTTPNQPDASTALASNSAPADHLSVTTAPAAAQPAARTPASSPAPIRAARRAPSSDEVTTSPAASAPATRTAPVQTPPASASASAQTTIVEPPAPVVQAPAPATQEAAPQASAPAAPADSGASAAPAESAPAEAPAAQ